MAGPNDNREQRGRTEGRKAASTPLFSLEDDATQSEALRRLNVVSTPTQLWSPQLTQRQRVLLHMEPLLHLYQHAGTRDSRHLRYDTLSLVVKLFDAIIDQSGFGAEVTRESVAAAVRPLLKASDDAAGAAPEPALHDDVVNRILAELKNESNRQQPFEIRYQIFDEQGRPQQHMLRFKLLMEQFGYSGDIVLEVVLRGDQPLSKCLWSRHRGRTGCKRGRGAGAIGARAFQ